MELPNEVPLEPRDDPGAVLSDSDHPRLLPLRSPGGQHRVARGVVMGEGSER